MEPLTRPTDLDRDTASFIAAGLRELARIDGTHASELALIEAFEAEIDAQPAAFDLSGEHPLTTPELRDLFLRSAIMLALADGEISELEGDQLGRWARELDVDVATLAELYTSVKQSLLRHFQGVTLFRDQVQQIGQELGLAEDEIETSLD